MPLLKGEGDRLRWRGPEEKLTASGGEVFKCKMHKVES